MTPENYTTMVPSKSKSHHGHRKHHGHHRNQPLNRRDESVGPENETAEVPSKLKSHHHHGHRKHHGNHRNQPLNRTDESVGESIQGSKMSTGKSTKPKTAAAADRVATGTSNSGNPRRNRSHEATFSHQRGGTPGVTRTSEDDVFKS